MIFFVMKYYTRLLIMSKRWNIPRRKKLLQFMSPESSYTLYYNSKKPTSELNHPCNPQKFFINFKGVWNAEDTYMCVYINWRNHIAITSASNSKMKMILWFECQLLTLNKVSIQPLKKQIRQNLSSRQWHIKISFYDSCNYVSLRS